MKPDLVLLGGSIAAAPMGDPNASIPTPQPVHYRPMFGAFGRAIASSAVTFVSQAAIDGYLAQRLGIAEEAAAREEHARRHLQEVDDAATTPRPTSRWMPETYEVRADGELLTCEPAKVLPMAQRYFLF